MFINKNNNGVRDDEVEDTPKKKIKLFKKKDKLEETVNKKSDGVDYNTKYLNNNKSTSEWLSALKTIIYFVVVVLIIVFVVPKLLHYDNNGKQTYIDNVNKMVDQIIVYYTSEDVTCTTETNGRYYFDVNNSKEMFGEDIKSPFIKTALEGYVEFMVTGENQYEVYVSFTDGFFGFERVKYSQLKPSNIKMFSYLSLNRHSEMTCNKPFVFSN